MPRENLVRRKSTGGKAPRKQLSAAARIRQFNDHNGRPYHVLPNGTSEERIIPKLGIQLYLVGNRENSDVVALAERFLGSDAIEGWGNARNYWPRVDVHTGLKTVEECIEHHKREKEFRMMAIEDMKRDAVAGLSEEAAKKKLLNEIRGREPLPHIVPSWVPSDLFWRENRCDGDRYRSWIMVVPEDRNSWEDVVEKGLLNVRFDLDVTPQMLTACWFWPDEDTLLDGDNEGWVHVDWSGKDKYTPVDIRLLCVREEPKYWAEPGTDQEEVMKKMMDDSWKTPGSAANLFHVWVDYTGLLWDCTYRDPECDACDEGEEHQFCEKELNEHYFDVDAQCIACRRAIEYRR